MSATTDATADLTTAGARPRMLLDCDPGLDDAVAIALALAHADVAAITTVGGNVGVEMTTTNALALSALLGHDDVPVHAGHDRPFGGVAVKRAAEIHGPNGMGETELPVPSHGPASDDAVAAILEAASTHDSLWLVATGPLTNIAHAVTADPSLPERVAGLSWMGGSQTHGNVTAAAEFNAWADPEAVDVVLGAGFVPLRMHGLDVTQTVLLDDGWIDELGRTGGRVAGVFADLLRWYRLRQAAQSSLAGAAVHDALAVAHVTHPEWFETTDRHVEAVLDGIARGMTLVDRRPRPEPHHTNVEVCDRADADAIRASIWSTLVDR